VVCSIGLVLLISVTKFLLQTSRGNPLPVTTLLVSTGVAAVYYLAFVLFSGFNEVREIVFETLDDLAPFMARRIRGVTVRIAA
jgi:hypothetical protein